MSYFWDDCAEYANAPAFRLPSGLVATYAQLLQRADEIIGNIMPGSLVVIECENHPDPLAAYVGCLRNRVVPLLVDGTLDIKLRRAMIDRFLPHAIFGRSSINSEFKWEVCHQYSPKLHPELAILLSTSGTTGSPRLVRLSRQNLQSNTEAIVSYLNITANDRPITSLPMHYSYGLSVINTHLFAGACILLTAKSVMERNFWSFFREAGATSLAGVPTTYEMLRRLRIERMELPDLRMLTQAGGRLTPEYVLWFGEFAKSRNVTFVVMYGQTEATARISYLPSKYVLEKPGSIGVVIPGGELFLRDSQGQLISQSGVVGELVYRGNNVMLGYAETLDELANSDSLAGELSTGDLAERDSDGFYSIVGRLKRFIKIHGNRISLDEIERRFHALGILAYATGRDDLLIIALVDDSIDTSTIKKAVMNDYKLHHSVVRVITCHDVPVSSTGKVQYPELLGLIDAKQKGGNGA